MKKLIASAGVAALGAMTIQAAGVAATGPSDKPWTVSLTLRGFYDDNTTLAPGAKQRQASFGMEARPKLGFSTTSDQTGFGAQYEYSMKYYADRPRNSRNHIDHMHEFTTWLMHAFTERYSLNVADTFTVAQEPTLLGSPGTVLRSNGDNIHNDGSINFHAQITRLLELVLGYRNQFYDYKAQGFSILLDRMEQSANLDLRWHALPDTYLVFGYQFGMVDYIDTQNNNLPGLAGAAARSDSRNSYSHYVYVGADHSFLRNLTGQVRAGAQIIDYYHSGRFTAIGTPNVKRTSVNPYVDLSMRYTYLAGSYLEAGFQHKRNQTDAFSLDQEASVFFTTLSHHITPKLVGTLTGQYQHAQFNGGVINNQDENTMLLGANLEYFFNRHFSAHVGYNYDGVHSDLANRGYDRNRAYLGVTASY